MDLADAPPASSRQMCVSVITESYMGSLDPEAEVIVGSDLYSFDLEISKLNKSLL